MKKFRELLQDGFFGSVQFISVFCFVSLVGIMGLIAGAEKKGEAVNTIATVFGAGGQVFFAYMVWKLSTRQFEFTKLVSNRQARMDAYAYRSALLTQLEEWWSEAFKNPNHDRQVQLIRLFIRVKFLFGDKVDNELAACRDKFSAFVDADQAVIAAIANDNAFENVPPARIKRFEASAAMGEAFTALRIALNNEMRIEVPDFHSDSV